MRAYLAANPFEYKVRSGYRNYLAGVGVEGIFTGQERLFPYAAFPAGDQLTMAIFLTGKILTRVTCIRHYYAHIPNFNNRLLDHLNRGEKTIDIVCAFDKHL